MTPLLLRILLMGMACSLVSCSRDVSRKQEPVQSTQTVNRALTIEPGAYEPGHPDEPRVIELLNRSTAAVWLSGHNGVSLERNNGDGWEHNLTLVQLMDRLKDMVDKSHASIILEKNYSGEDKLDQKVAEALTQIGFKTIVVQSCFSTATVIDDIITNE